MTDFIDIQRATYADLADKYSVLGDLYEKKLWHQFTVGVLEFVRDPDTNRGDNLLQLYEKFISTVEGKLDQLQLVQILAAINAQYYPDRPYALSQIERAESHLAAFLDKKARLGPDAFLVLQMELLSLKLKRASILVSPTEPSHSTLLDECKKEMLSGKDALETLPDGTEPVVTATVHRVAADYYKQRGPAHLFYASSLLYLGHTPMERLPSSLRASIAVDIAVAALVGEGIYNFGEVNAHAILGALEGTPHAWLVDLLRVFQTGDIAAFDTISAARKGDMASIQQLVAHAPVVREKITLLRLMEMAASRPAHGRSLRFTEISTSCRLPLDAVEHLALRSLSLGLLKGSLDEVEEVFHVSFVTPRVLSLDQIRALKGGLDSWQERAGETLAFLEEHSREVLDIKQETA